VSEFFRAYLPGIGVGLIKLEGEDKCYSWEPSRPRMRKNKVRKFWLQFLCEYLNELNWADPGESVP